jgi:hypothetical protein
LPAFEGKSEQEISQQRNAMLEELLSLRANRSAQFERTLKKQL